MSSRAGSALIAVLIVMAVLGFLWVGDWVLRLTDEMTRDRVIQMEQKHRSASQAEWDALDRLIQEADPLEGWQPIEYVIPDGVSERVVSLKLANVNGWSRIGRLYGARKWFLIHRSLNRHGHRGNDGDWWISIIWPDS